MNVASTAATNLRIGDPVPGSTQSGESKKFNIKPQRFFTEVNVPGFDIRKAIASGIKKKQKQRETQKAISQPQPQPQPETQPRPPPTKRAGRDKESQTWPLFQQ